MQSVSHHAGSVNIVGNDRHFAHEQEAGIFGHRDAVVLEAQFLHLRNSLLFVAILFQLSPWSALRWGDVGAIVHGRKVSPVNPSFSAVRRDKCGKAMSKETLAGFLLRNLIAYQQNVVTSRYAPQARG